MNSKLRLLGSVLVLTASLAVAGAVMHARGVEMGGNVAADGIVRVSSAYGFAETIERLKADIAAKKIKFFLAVDQASLAATAGITLKPSTLLMFGNPALGTQFITSRPEAGLDWPVRLLVSETPAGLVQLSYTDFGWIARRHGITDRDAQFRKASEVIASITGSVAARKQAAQVN